MNWSFILMTRQSTLIMQYLFLQLCIIVTLLNQCIPMFSYIRIPFGLVRLTTNLLQQKM